MDLRLEEVCDRFSDQCLEARTVTKTEGMNRRESSS